MPRNVEGHYVNGKWVNTGVSPVKGSDDTSATTRAGLKSTGGLAARVAAGKAGRPKLPKRADFATEQAYNSAYAKYREASLSDPDAMAQKKALGRMK